MDLVKKTASLLLVAGALATASIAIANDGPRQGARTLNFNGLYDDLGGDRSWNINVGGSYFITDAFEGLAQLAFSENRSGGMTSRITGFGIGVNYYFNTNNYTMQQFYPYIGARYTRFDVTGAPNVNAWSGALGLHYFLRPGVSVNPELQVGSVSGGGRSSYTSLGIGLTIWLD